MSDHLPQRRFRITNQAQHHARVKEIREWLQPQSTASGSAHARWPARERPDNAQQVKMPVMNPPVADPFVTWVSI